MNPAPSMATWCCFMTRPSSGLVAAGDGEELNRLIDPLQRMVTTTDRRYARAEYQAVGRRRQQDLARGGRGRHTSCQVDRDAAHVLACVLDLAGVQPGPLLKVEDAHAARGFERAANGMGR